MLRKAEKCLALINVLFPSSPPTTFNILFLSPTVPVEGVGGITRLPMVQAEDAGVTNPTLVPIPPHDIPVLLGNDQNVFNL